eukprot:m.7703 g.7703  ORF g.7703 m.7703 type:complete len:115 (-) comp2790_c0_seq2:45-389(-)
MHRLRPRGRRQQRYTQLDNDVGFLDAQFERGEPKVPVRSIVLAVVLFIVGSVFLIVGTCLFTGVIDTKYSDRWLPMAILGGLMFIPGSYHTYLAYYAWQGAPGYTFDDIPDFDY